jgi:cyclopropane-fatty-acyl-phospholipid synthase
MEQVAKRTGTLVIGNSVSISGANEKYRTLVFNLLDGLCDARLEVVEGDNTEAFGDTESSFVGVIQVTDQSFYKDVVFSGSIGAAEAYLEGKWSSPDLTQVIRIMARNQSRLDEIDNKTRWVTSIRNWWLRRQNLNSEKGSKRNILAHYDIGNDLYQRFLDASMQYSSAIYSADATNLPLAQKNKMRIICERLDLKPEDHVIEIGTGWGGLAIYMATHVGCKVTTTTISDAQFDYAQQKVNQLNLNDKITLLKQDYRQLEGQYDKLVSIEMIEAVGHEYLSAFFTTCSGLLKPDGKMLLQSITIADGRYEQYRKKVDFIQKYIFPGGCLPSIAVMASHMATSTDMVIEAIDDIGLHYARTLSDWTRSFEQSWPELAELGYSEEFKRLWRFYLSYCEGAFIERVISTHHIVARKPRYFGAEDEMVLDY